MSGGTGAANPFSSFISLKNGVAEGAPTTKNVLLPRMLSRRRRRSCSCLLAPGRGGGASATAPGSGPGSAPRSSGSDPSARPSGPCSAQGPAFPASGATLEENPEGKVTFDSVNWPSPSWQFIPRRHLSPTTTTTERNGEADRSTV